MFLLKLLSFLALCWVSKCNNKLKKLCIDDYRDLNSVTIDVNKYCSDEWCIQKCCPPEYCISALGTCEKIQDLRKSHEKFQKLFTLIDYENITFYSNTEPRQKIKKNFKYIQNYKNYNMSTCGYIHDTIPYENEYYFTENASVKVYEKYSKEWYTFTATEYCVDYAFIKRNGNFTISLVLKEYYPFPEDDGLNDTMLLIGLLISSVFLLLVFVVHCMLKTLHSSFTGLLMMAYTITILLAFVVKVIMQASIAFMTSYSCKIITPFLYFLLMSSFFWLNAFSFCIWRGLRQRVGLYKASRREKLLSFSRYSLYAWGLPLVLTGIAIYLDNIDLSKWDYIIKPPFEDCFKNPHGVQRYYFIPLGIIMFINIVLFIITIYHILTTTYSTKRNAEFRRSGRENSYKTYMKLSLTMGISWVLELIPNSNNTFLFILSNTYNSLIGVIIFFVYIFDKNVLNELCKKFNIQNDFIIKIARRKSLFRLARSMKVNREELVAMRAPTTTSTTGQSSVAENETSLLSCTL